LRTGLAAANRFGWIFNSISLPRIGLNRLRNRTAIGSTHPQDRDGELLLRLLVDPNCEIKVRAEAFASARRVICILEPADKREVITLLAQSPR
jgi:hypothetical protein